jgi:hypothetical protein
MAYMKKADREKMEQEVTNTDKPSTAALSAVKLKIQYKPFDAFEVPKEVKAKYPESAYHLLWARNDAKRTRTLEQIGYDYCTIEPDKNVRSDRREDGYIRNGDSILMYCSVELYQSRNEYFSKKTKALQPKTNKKNIDINNQIEGLHPDIKNELVFSQTRGAE